MVTDSTDAYSSSVSVQGVPLPAISPDIPIVILGPTASGKSELAMALCRVLESAAEIVVADSMQVYRGMDIGTAKPTFDEQAEVRHHCINLLEPTEDFSLSIYKHSAQSALEKIAYSSGTQISQDRHDKTSRAYPKTPVIVGGTGLYIRAVVDDLQIPPQYPEVKTELENEPDTKALWARLQELDKKASEAMLPGNRRRIIRALEVTLGSGRPFSSFGSSPDSPSDQPSALSSASPSPFSPPSSANSSNKGGLKTYEPSSFLQIGIKLPRKKLDERIEERYELQMEAGFLDEVKRLHKMPLSKTARQALGYRELLAYLNGELGLSAALDEARRRTKKFARRQERWFRRDPRIKWIQADTPKKAAADLFQLVN